MNLPDLYTRVVAHNPKLEVRRFGGTGVLECVMEHEPGMDDNRGEWYFCRNKGETDPPEFLVAVPAWCLEALIADHWTESLPSGYAVMHGSVQEKPVWIVGVTSDEDSNDDVVDATRLEALAAFFLAQPAESRP